MNFVNLIFALGLFALIVYLVIFYLIYRRTALHDERGKASTEIITLEDELAETRRLLSNLQGDVDKAVKGYVEVERLHQLRSLPIEKVKDAGASNVRLSSLKNAGYHTVYDLREVSPQHLARIYGVGEHTARSVVEAAKRIIRHVETTPVNAPNADLKDSVSEQVAARVLQLVEAREQLLKPTNDIADKVAVPADQLREYRSRTRFSRWLISSDEKRRKIYEYSSSKAVALTTEAELLRQSGSFIVSRAARERLKLDRESQLDRGKLEPLLRARYADYSSCYEEALLRVSGAKSSPVASRTIPKEIADEVEAFKLQTRDLRITLRSYQEFGAKYILARERTILGDEMGLGKTIEALAAIVHNWSTNHGGHYLVVPSAGLTANWIQEIQARTGIPYCLLHGPDRQSLVTQWLSTGGIAVISYNTLIGTPLATRLRDMNRKIDILICDEAHYVKNPNAERTASVKELAVVAQTVCLMSGTPMENHPGEFRDLIDVVRPGKGQSLKQETVVADLLFNTPSRFHARVAGIYLRRNQEDVLRELPEKIEIPEWVDLEDGDLIAYRNAVCHGDFMAMRKTATIGLGEGVSSKINRLNELLDDHRESGRKVIIFSFFLDVLSLLESQMNVLGKITGSMDASQRLRLVDTFREQPNHQILLAQIEAGGQGLNLQAASVVVSHGASIQTHN